MGNFSFLDESWADAGRVAKKAEDILHQDPSAAIQHLRKFGEMLTKIIFSCEGLVESEGSNQFDRLAILEQKLIIPPRVKDMFHSLRKAGNYAIHEDSGTIGEAIVNLERAFLISIWAYQTYDDASYKAIEFEIPPKEKPNISELHISNDKIMNTPFQDVLPKDQDKPKTILSQVRQANLQNTGRRRRKPGEINRNNQELIIITNIHGKSKPDQYIWILRCTECSHEYGANGCDFHIRKCPNCQSGRPGEPEELWREVLVGEKSMAGNGVGDNSVNITLHEAIRMVLLETDDGIMSISDIADQIVSRGLYKKKKNGNMDLPTQVFLRSRNYPNIFDILPDKHIKLIDK